MEEVLCTGMASRRGRCRSRLGQNPVTQCTCVGTLQTDQDSRLKLLFDATAPERLANVSQTRPQRFMEGRLFSVVLWELVKMVSEGLTITFAQLCYWFDPPEGISMRPGPNLVNICSIHARQPEVCFLESVVPCLAVASLHCSQAAPGQFLLVPRKFPCSLLFCRSRLSGCPLPAEKAARPRDLLTQTSERPAPTCQKLSMHLSG